MNCVTKDCEAQAQPGEFHCMSHDEKKQAPCHPTLDQVQALTIAKKCLATWGDDPPTTARSLTFFVLNALGLNLVCYDEVALVLRQAVDSGDLVSYEKNDTTFYKLPEPKVDVAEQNRAVLQAAIDAAQSGDTIHAPSGYTRGGIRITKPITIRGAQVSDTMVDWPDNHIYGNTIVDMKVQDFAGDRIEPTPADPGAWILCGNCTRTHPPSFVTGSGAGARCGHCMKAFREGQEWAASASFVEPDVVVDLRVKALIDEMLATGLYGATYGEFVREAICERVREYVKGKK
jgi:hypothetical protein